MLFRFNQISIVWFRRELTTAVLLHQGNSWQSHNLILWIHKMRHSFGSIRACLAVVTFVAHQGALFIYLFFQWASTVEVYLKTLMWAKTAGGCLDLWHENLTQILQRFCSISARPVNITWLFFFFSFLRLIVLNEILNIPTLSECVIEWWCIFKLMRSGRRGVKCRKMFLIDAALFAVWLTCNPRPDRTSFYFVYCSHAFDSHSERTRHSDGFESSLGPPQTTALL